MWLYWSCA